MFQKYIPKRIKIDKIQWRPSQERGSVSVTLRRSVATRRYIKVLIGSDGKITVSGPRAVSKKLMLQVLAEKELWILDELKRLKREGKIRDEVAEKRHYHKHREQARALVEEKLSYWNQYYGYPYGRITIRNQRTRWGSCSRKGNLSFHYKILFLPESLADYLIVHELCHLKAFDHSPRFWSLVAKTIPHYTELRRSLHQSQL